MPGPYPDAWPLIWPLLLHASALHLTSSTHACTASVVALTRASGLSLAEALALASPGTMPLPQTRSSPLPTCLASSAGLGVKTPKACAIGTAQILGHVTTFVATPDPARIVTRDLLDAIDAACADLEHRADDADDATVDGPLLGVRPIRYVWIEAFCASQPLLNGQFLEGAPNEEEDAMRRELPGTTEMAEIAAREVLSFDVGERRCVEVRIQ